MKKVVYVTLVLLVILIGNCYADISQWGLKYFVDEFGDMTNEPFLNSEDVRISYGSYAWEDAHCRILIDKKYVSFFLERVVYDEWIVKTKTPEGETHTFYCNLEDNNRVYMLPYNFKHNSQVDIDKFLSDLVLGSRVIAYPENKYSKDKYDFGIVSLKLEDLRKIRPDFEAKK